MSANPTTWVFNQDMLRIAFNNYDKAHPEGLVGPVSLQAIEHFLNSPEAKKLRVESAKDNGSA